VVVELAKKSVSDIERYFAKNVASIIEKYFAKISASDMRKSSQKFQLPIWEKFAIISTPYVRDLSSQLLTMTSCHSLESEVL
jgi:phage terminase large subunit-like protein